MKFRKLAHLWPLIVCLLITGQLLRNLGTELHAARVYDFAHEMDYDTSVYNLPSTAAIPVAPRRPATDLTRSAASLPPRMIIKMKNEPTETLTLMESTGSASLDALMTRFNVQAAAPLFDGEIGDPALKQELGLPQIYALTLSSSTNLQEALSAFSDDDLIAYAEPDFIGYGAGIPDDQWFDYQWNLHNTGQSDGEPDADIDAPAAWDISPGTTSTVLAIIDTGVDLAHPELAAKVVDGYDFVNDDDIPQDDHDHGTHVAGIATAATNNSIGMAGVCPRCRVMPLKALDSDNQGYYSWWANAIEYAVDHGSNVINMSLGGTADSQLLHDAVRYAYEANVPIVAAMMNDGDSTPYYPATFTETIAVGATDRNDERWSDSNFGEHIDLVAPGVSVLGTIRDSTYAFWDGTSMATPHVAGVLGLVHSVRPGYTVEELRTVLCATADDQVGPSNEDKKGWDPYYGSGRLNAAQAMQFVVPPSGIDVSGPSQGLIQTEHVFTATVGPITATQPLTYTWRANGQTPVVHTANLSDTLALTWSTDGTYIITVSATNFAGTVTGTCAITIGHTLPGLTVCHGGGCDYANIQDAVDAAGDGSVVKIASGVYTDVNTRGNLSQAIYISKTITIRGGYTPAFTEPPAPQTNPTTVDAQGGGRVLYITAPTPDTGAGPTIEGLHITGGDATGLSGGVGGGDAGGGVYVMNADATIRNNHVFSNTARWGGGLYLHESAATLSGNTFSFNDARWGGGLYLWKSDTVLDANTVVSNKAEQEGGGVYLSKGDATWTNNIIADNQADRTGSGLHVRSASPRLLHTTFVHNRGGDGRGICVDDDESIHSHVMLTNTIVVSHATGIAVTDGNTATLEATLWGKDNWANTLDWDGTGTIITGTSAYNYWRDPAFEAPEDGNYHIIHSSAARDGGINAGVGHDIDGHPRPIGESYDIGADEFPAALTVTKQANGQLVPVGTQLTYTIRVTNTGHVDLHTVVTDILPAHIGPDTGSLRTWTPTIAAAGGAWASTVVLSVGTEHRGTLTNVVQVATEEGAVAADTCSVIVADKLATIRPSESNTFVASNDEGIRITVKIPMGAVTETTQLAYTPVPSITDVPSGLAFAGYAFRLAAYRNDALHTGLAFEKPITVTIHYAALNTTGLDENTLELRYWDGHAWSSGGITVVDRDTAANQLTVTIAHLSDFAIFSEKQQVVYLPIVMCQHLHSLPLSHTRR